MRRGGSGQPRRHRSAPSRRSGGFISVGVVLALTVGLIGTVLGVGATSRSLNVADGDIWLWSSKPAQVSRVNANSGRVDQNQPLLDSRGHHVEITQNDKYLLLHDLDDGKITSVDLTRMGFTGSLTVDKGPGVRVALSGDKAVLINQKTGEIRGFDPDNLRTTSATLHLPAPLAGGDFDASGALWVGVPSQGTVVSVSVSAKHATVQTTQNATDPGHPMALTVLDNGALAADRSSDTVAVVTEKVVTHTTKASLADALLPDRTVGSLAVLTLPKQHKVLPISVRGSGDDRHGSRAVRGFDLPAGVSPGAATPFAGRIYVPDAKRHVVYVFDRSGKSLGALGLAGATGPLELQVREDHLVINAPDSSVARVVDRDGVTRIVNKYQTNQQGDSGDLSVIAAPAPGKHRGKASHGDDSRAADGPPGPPIPVTALAGSHKVTLSWPTPAENGAPIKRYDISWDGGRRRVDAGTHNLVVSNLHNGRSYSFAVSATNKFGTGPQALSDRVTPGSKVPDVPKSVRASVADSGAVKVTWGAADEADRYVVTPSNGGQPRTVTQTSAQFDTTTLTPGRSYTFTVMSQTRAGTASAPSAPSNAVTPYGKPAPPEAAQVKQTGQNEWTVSWKPGNDNGSKITGYTVTGPGGPKKVGAGATSATLTGSGGTFTVAATNAAGTGDPATAAPQAPDPPTVKITNATTNGSSVTVKLQASGVAVDGCTVTVQGAGGGSKQGDCNQITVTSGLYASSKYTVSATAHNAGGDSPQDTSSVTTPTIKVTVTCTNDPSRGGEGATYCNPGIGRYQQPKQVDGTGKKTPNHSTHAAICQTTGQKINSYTYHDNKVSNIWIKLEDGMYMPWAWLEGNIGNLHKCQ